MRRLPVDPNAIEAAEAKPTTTGHSDRRGSKPVATKQKDDYTSRLLKAKKQVWKTGRRIAQMWTD